MIQLTRARSAHPPKSATMDGRAIATTMSSAPPSSTPRLATASVAHAATGCMRTEAPAPASVTGPRARAPPARAPVRRPSSRGRCRHPARPRRPAGRATAARRARRAGTGHPEARSSSPRPRGGPRPALRPRPAPEAAAFRAADRSRCSARPWAATPPTMAAKARRLELPDRRRRCQPSERRGRHQADERYARHRNEPPDEHGAATDRAGHEPAGTPEDALAGERAGRDRGPDDDGCRQPDREPRHRGGCRRRDERHQGPDADVRREQREQPKADPQLSHGEPGDDAGLAHAGLGARRGRSAASAARIAASASMPRCDSERPAASRADIGAMSSTRPPRR